MGNMHHTHEFALIIQLGRAESLSGRPLFERVEVQAAHVVHDRRAGDHADVLIGARVRSRYKGGDKKLCEVEVSKHIGAHLEVVPVGSELVDGGLHDTSTGVSP